MNRDKIIFILILGITGLSLVIITTSFRWQLAQTDRTPIALTETALARRSAEIAAAEQDVSTAVRSAAGVHATETYQAATAVAIESTRTVLEASAAAIAATTKEGLIIQIASVKYDAWPWIQAQNQFNDPPLRGKRMLMVHLVVTNRATAADTALRIEESDFQIAGDRGELYSTYGEETSCGVVPDALGGVLMPGETMSGNVCIQVPKAETALQLVYHPYIQDDVLLYFDLPPIPADQLLGR